MPPSPSWNWKANCKWPAFIRSTSSQERSPTISRIIPTALRIPYCICCARQVWSVPSPPLATRTVYTSGIFARCESWGMPDGSAYGAIKESDWLQGFAHRDEFNGLAGSYVDVHLGAADITASGIEPDAGKRRHEFNLGVSVRACLLLAMLEQQGADAAASVAWVDKESADLRRFSRRVKGRWIAPGAGVAAEQRRSKAPPAAAHNLPAIFDHEVSLVGQQLRIDAECAAQGTLNLRRTVILAAQDARGAGNQRIERRYIGKRGVAQDRH